jgi:hypothetical protein
MLPLKRFINDADGPVIGYEGLVHRELPSLPTARLVAPPFTAYAYSIENARFCIPIVVLGPVIRESLLTAPFPSEIPAFPNQSLPGIWSGLLNPDLSDKDDVFDWDNSTATLDYTSEDCIQTWAEEYQPLEVRSSNAISALEPAEISPENAHANIVCYGMVRHCIPHGSSRDFDEEHTDRR